MPSARPSGPAALMDTLQPWVVPRYKQWGPSRTGKRRLEPDAEGAGDDNLNPAPPHWHWQLLPGAEPRCGECHPS